MVRIEVFANRSLEENIMEQLDFINCHHYSKVPIVYGTGNHDPKQGDAIWPEINFMLIIYCEDEEVDLIKSALKVVKKQFPLEGIRIFVLKAELL
jgi:hypothetical protein